MLASISNCQEFQDNHPLEPSPNHAQYFILPLVRLEEALLSCGHSFWIVVHPHTDQLALGIEPGDLLDRWVQLHVVPTPTPAVHDQTLERWVVGELEMVLLVGRIAEEVHQAIIGVHHAHGVS